MTGAGSSCSEKKKDGAQHTWRRGMSGRPSPPIGGGGGHSCSGSTPGQGQQPRWFRSYSASSPRPMTGAAGDTVIHKARKPYTGTATLAPPRWLSDWPQGARGVTQSPRSLPARYPRRPRRHLWWLNAEGRDVDTEIMGGLRRADPTRFSEDPQGRQARQRGVDLSDERVGARPLRSTETPKIPTKNVPGEALFCRTRPDVHGAAEKSRSAPLRETAGMPVGKSIHEWGNVGTPWCVGAAGTTPGDTTPPANATTTSRGVHTDGVHRAV